MKKLLLTILILLFFTPIYSQKVSLGPELGVNVIPMENTDYGYNYQLGFHFGGHLKYHINDKFRVSTGLYLTQKKKAYSSSETSSLLNALGDMLGLAGGNTIPGLDTVNLDSLINIPGINLDMKEEVKGTNSEILIEIPLLANYKAGNVNFYLGSYFGLVIGATQKEEITTSVPAFDVIDISSIDPTGFASFFLPQSGVESSTSSGTNGLNLMDVGACGGIGYEMNNLHFNLMYLHGFLDYRDDRGSEDFSSLRTFRLSMVYLFDLKQNKESAPRLD